MRASLPSLLRHYSQVFPVGSAQTRFPHILAARRQRHLEALDSFAIFAGVPHEPGAENLWHMNALKIFQEPAVMHLCGINQPQIVLALVPGTKGRAVLFLPYKDPAREFWDGIRFGIPKENPQAAPELDDVRRLTGIEEILPHAEFGAWFQALVRGWKQPFGYAFFHQYRDPDHNRTRRTRTDHNYACKQSLERWAGRVRGGFEIRTCADLHFRLRLPLEPEQVRDVDRAVAITRSAFLETLPALRRLRDENALAAHLEYGMRRRSPYGLSFPSIVASGKNATVLHYLKNDDRIDRRGLVLMDFGARFGTMHADITRTVPAAGRFNPLQELLYRIVLDAMKLNQDHARPGARIRALNDAVWNFLEDALETRFLARGGKMRRAYPHKPHGVSHLMGEQEHDGDPHRFYQDLDLQPGWQLSNEPGLYGHFEATLHGRHYAQWIGIRIEDDLLITKAGCRNLSASIPREPTDLEECMRSDSSS